MGNDMADAIRNELRSALLAAYGTLELAAEALGMPYKTLRRHLTPGAKDRTERVSLDFVLETSDHLSNVSGTSFNEIYRRAQLSTNARKADYDLVANESIDETYDVPDSDFDNA